MVNRRTGAVLGDRLEKAERFGERLKGLLGRPRLEAGEGLILDRCASVHTCFMGFPIDLCFLDAAGRVVRTLVALPPWRAASAVGAVWVVELPAGTLVRTEVREGDVLEAVPCA